MTKEQKILLLLVLAVSAAGATLYVSNQKDKVLSSVSAETEMVADTHNQITQPVQSSPKEEAGTAQGSASATENQSAGNQKITQQITYSVPENHSNTLSVTVTLLDGVIVDVSFSEQPTNKESKEYYEKFSRTFSNATVVGQPIGAVSLSRIGGASLTTKAFNEALRSIAQDIRG
ncbi:MAG: hypothetical protein RLZZ308_313 [Candidatus Parcubacteria bacterium]|jgi:hypothetical protein